MNQSLLASAFVIAIAAGPAAAQTGSGHQSTPNMPGPATQSSQTFDQSGPSRPMSSENANQSDGDSKRPSAAPAGSPTQPSSVHTKDESSDGASAKSAGETTSGPAGRGGGGSPQPK